VAPVVYAPSSRVVWDCSSKPFLRGGRSLLKLNIDERPIANKYREGKMKRTLKRGLKVLEIVNREANRTGKDEKENQSLKEGLIVW
jgi:hypothetical protein